MDESYQIDGMRCVWGIKSYDDLSGGSEATLWTMNDFDITYLEELSLTGNTTLFFCLFGPR